MWLTYITHLASVGVWFCDPCFKSATKVSYYNQVFKRHLSGFSEIQFKIDKSTQTGLTLGTGKRLNHWAIGVLLGFTWRCHWCWPRNQWAVCPATWLGYSVCCPVVSLRNLKVSLLFLNEICTCGDWGLPTELWDRALSSASCCSQAWWKVRSCTA